MTKTDLLVVFSTEGEKPSVPKGVTISEKVLSAFSGKERETRLTDAVEGAAEQVLMIGLGAAGEAETVRRAAAIAVKKAEKIEYLKSVGLDDLIDLSTHASIDEGYAELLD